MAKKKPRKRRPPPRRPQSATERTEQAEADRQPSRRAERKEEARRERERRIKAARRRQRNRRLIRWGAALGVVALIAGFIYLQGTESRRVQARAAAAIERLGCTPVEEQEDLGASHTPPFAAGTGGIPATSGSHSNPLQPDPQIFDQPVPEENALHSMEHGGVLVYYAGDGDNALPEDSISVLEGVVESNAEVYLAPYEGLASSLAFASWRTLQTCSPEGTADPQDVESVAAAFIDEWLNSGRAPEPAA